LLQRIREHSFGFVELAPTDDGAQAAVADVLAGRREADGSDVVAEADRLFHAQDGYVVDESRVHVARMDEDVRYDAHLLVRRQQIRSATQCTQTGHPVFILSIVETVAGRDEPTVGDEGSSALEIAFLVEGGLPRPRPRRRITPAYDPGTG